jgi:hypothetical protein
LRLCVENGSDGASYQCKAAKQAIHSSHFFAPLHLCTFALKMEVMEQAISANPQNRPVIPAISLRLCTFAPLR